MSRSTTHIDGASGHSPGASRRLDGPLLRPEHPAELLNVKTSWVYDAVRTGRLPCLRVGRHIGSSGGNQVAAGGSASRSRDDVARTAVEGGKPKYATRRLIELMTGCGLYATRRPGEQAVVAVSREKSARGKPQQTATRVVSGTRRAWSARSDPRRRRAHPFRLSPVP
jgi:excisionase family DNA binding protein